MDNQWCKGGANEAAALGFDLKWGTAKKNGCCNSHTFTSTAVVAIKSHHCLCVGQLPWVPNHAITSLWRM